MSTETEDRISGEYKHYKGHCYDVFCVAFDKDGNKYVLYRQCYGDKSFWIRPYSIFFESVEVNGKSVSRFTLNSPTPQPTNEKIKQLIEFVEDQGVSIRHAKTGCSFIITHISESSDFVRVHQVEHNNFSGYLTEYEIAKRLGYNSCCINGKIKYFKETESIGEHKALHIDNNDIESLKQFLNPCSVDLQIASSGFLRTKFKFVDPQSVEHISSATELWKPVKKHRSKNNALNYIRIYPGATILTHTKQRIRIPDDCAGKVEIKSTFARLSLSITFGDFCNPGYDGHFPLEIKNNGRHTVIIHENETMIQLMLVPLQGPIFNEYSTKSTYKNDKGFDDGTPYGFWRERSIEAIRKENGTQQIIDLFHNLEDKITDQNTSDVNACRDRFDDNFLPFCCKHIGKSRYRDNDSDLPDTEMLIEVYIKREQRLKALFEIRWFLVILDVICALLPCILQFIQNSRTPEDPVTLSTFWPIFAIAGILFVTTIILHIFCPKTFCTFENIDIDEQLRAVRYDCSE